MQSVNSQLVINKLSDKIKQLSTENAILQVHIEMLEKKLEGDSDE